MYTCTHYLTNFNHFWHRDYKEVKIMRDAHIFHPIKWAILYVTHGTFAHFREVSQILGYHLEITLNVFK